MKSRYWCLLGLLVCCQGSATAAEEKFTIAVPPQISVLGELQDAFATLTNTWFEPLQALATWILLSLALIMLVWIFIQAVINNSPANEMIFSLVRYILLVGFFLALIDNADVWSQKLIQGFAYAADQATGHPHDPNAGEYGISALNVMERGFVVAEKLLNMPSAWWEVPIVFLAAGLIVCLYAFIAAYMLLVFAEVYLITACGVLFLGFAGTEWTMDYARRYLTYCVSVGAKLYALMLVVGLGNQMIDLWVAESVAGKAGFSVLGVISMLIVLVMLSTTLPNMVQGIINGSSIGSGGPAMTAIMNQGFRLVANAVTGIAKTATAGMDATKIAKATLGVSGGPAGKGAVARSAMGSLGKAALGTLTGKGSMAGQLRSQRLDLEGADAAKQTIQDTATALADALKK